MSQLGFFHDNDSCISCRNCIIACKDKNDLPLGEKFRRVYDYAGGSWEVDTNGAYVGKDNFAYSVSVACMHCETPACMTACPVTAIKKREEDGVVWIDDQICIGCGACVTACPYNAPYLSQEKGIARKCDLCRSLIDNDEDPACVACCPTRCLNYGEIENLKSSYGDLQQVAPLPEASMTGPSVVFNPSRLNPDGKLKGEVLNAPEEIESAAV